MASIQRFTSGKHTYFRIVESYRRDDGHPTVRVLEHLGKAEELLARLRDNRGKLRLRSVSSGAVDALHALAVEFDVAGEIDRAVAARAGVTQTRDGLTVGESLVAAAIARACHPTSKRAFAAWAADTSLPARLGVDTSSLTSQHFWDQMDVVPLGAISDVEGAVVGRVLDVEKLKRGVLAYDTTNFFTFIDTANERCELAQRGHNKAGRHGLRQLGLALVVSEDGQLPLWKSLYRGSRSDVRTLKEELEPSRRQLRGLVAEAQQLTFVFDQGGESRENLGAIVEGGDHFVTALKPSHHRKLLAEASSKLEPVTLSTKEIVRAHRTRTLVHGEQQDVIVVWSKHLFDGQRRGLDQALQKALRTIARISKHPRGGIAGAQTQVARACNKQYVRQILTAEVVEENGTIKVTPRIDVDARNRLERTYFGLRVLATSNPELTTREVIEAYRGQLRVERAFRDLKDPWSCSFRPQYHWTDQKIAVHALISFLALLLARVLLRRARALNFAGSQGLLLQQLARIRTARVIRATEKQGRPRVSSQIEECDPALAKLGLRLRAIDPALYIPPVEGQLE